MYFESTGWDRTSGVTGFVCETSWQKYYYYNILGCATKMRRFNLLLVIAMNFFNNGITSLFLKNSSKYYSRKWITCQEYNSDCLWFSLINHKQSNYNRYWKLTKSYKTFMFHSCFIEYAFVFDNSKYYSQVLVLSTSVNSRLTHGTKFGCHYYI